MEAEGSTELAATGNHAFLIFLCRRLFLRAFLLPFQLTHLRVDYGFKLYAAIICDICIVPLSLSKHLVNICELLAVSLWETGKAKFAFIVGVCPQTVV